MTSFHARTRSHPGQARSAPRKRLRQLQNRIASGNYAQARQNKVRCSIRIQGQKCWTDVFENKTVSIRPGAERYYGGSTVATLDYYRVNADMNRVSFERSIISALLSLGYQLEELEVEFEENSGREGFGVCRWHKSHPAYEKPLGKGFSGLDPSLFYAMFATQHAGDQHAPVYSMQMIGASLVGQPQILLHKTLIFRKVVLSPPKERGHGLQAAA